LSLDDRDRQEIKTLVAEEIHQVLRREMARWWAESILALAGYPPHSQWGSHSRGAGSAGSGESAGQQAQAKTKTVRPRPVGRPRPQALVPDGAGDDSPSPDSSNGSTGGNTSAVDYLTGVVESLLRTQESLAEQLQASMAQLEGLLRESQGRQGT